MNSNHNSTLVLQAKVKVRTKPNLIRRIIFPCISVCLGLGIALLILELTLRILGWPAPGFYQNGMGPLQYQIPTSEGGAWRAYPGKARQRHYDFDIPIYINAHGFRSSENRPKEFDEWRIGVFGDSFTDGWGVRREERFGEVWMKEAKDVLGNTTLWNFGSIDSGTWQNADFLDAGGKEYQLDEIILAVFSWNELSDNILWSNLRNLSNEDIDEQYRKKFSGMRTWIRTHIRTASFLWINFLRSAPKGPPPASKQTIDTYWPYTKAGFDAFKDATGDRPLTIWYLPGRVEWDDNIWRIHQQEQDLDESERFLLRQYIQSWAEANNVPFVDVTPWLAGRPSNEVSFPVDPHWSPGGHSIVGKGLAKNKMSSFRQRSEIPSPSS